MCRTRQGQARFEAHLRAREIAVTQHREAEPPLRGAHPPTIAQFGKERPTPLEVLARRLSQEKADVAKSFMRFGHERSIVLFRRAGEAHLEQPVRRASVLSTTRERRR